ncbi:MAG TPA: isocitrate lyase/phosphoenolpyruvate mutase family protein [Pyrinomonadaceae bacterium]
MLEGPRAVVLGGAHDALSARLVEQAGFEGVWASSFGIALASQCAPDMDLLTMTETLDVVRHITRAVSVPVIIDGNSGYGDVTNVMRTIRESEDLGAAAICIEDNAFPKRCSLYDNEQRELVSIEKMVAKIRAAKLAQRDQNFTVIARVESLIANHGLDAALERAAAYQQAGADAILIHSKKFPPLKEFTRRWNGGCPLVVVPTLFAQVSLADLEDCGFRVVIFANQAVRAATRAMRETLETLRRTGTISSVSESIAPLEDVYRLVRLKEIENIERELEPRQPPELESIKKG